MLELLENKLLTLKDVDVISISLLGKYKNTLYRERN